MPTESPTDVVRCPTCRRRNRVPAHAPGVPHCGTCHAALPWLVEAGDTTFDLVAVRSPLPVLVDLWAPWCGPCRMVSPAVERISVDRAGRLKVVKVNVDVAPRTAARYEAMSIPTLLVLSDGQVRDRIVGALPEPALRQRVDTVIGAAPS